MVIHEMMLEKCRDVTGHRASPDPVEAQPAPPTKLVVA